MKSAIWPAYDSPFNSCNIKGCNTGSPGGATDLGTEARGVLAY